MEDIIKQQINKSVEIKLKCINKLSKEIETLTQKIVETYNNGGKVLLFGNGGSAADAQHVAGELVGHFNIDRPSLPAIALTTDTSILTCISNDYEYDMIFSRQIEGLGNSEDIAIGISTSGNSGNVVKAIKTAKELGLFTVGFTGEKGGKLKEISDLLINVPSESTPRIQESHITIFHIICDLVETNLNF